MAKSFNSPRWGNWWTLTAVVVAVALLRVAYLIWLCPYQLVDDEAQYWDWSRRFEWSYCTKGPGVAWAIAASTAVFGNAEWAVRLPVVVAWAVSALALAKLASDCAGDDVRAGWLAAAGFALVPAYTAAGQLMTIDAPLIACWTVALWAGWRVGQRPESWLGWLALGTALGVGFLFKYTMLLLLPGLVVFAILSRRAVPWTQRAIAPALTALTVLLLLLSPVFIWNQSRHWPTLRHLLWHVGVSESGAVAPAAKTTVTAHLWWPFEMGLSQLGVIGPLFALAWLAVARPRELNTREQLAQRYWLCGAVPILVFYLGVSFFTEVNANWPIAGSVALLGLVSQAGDRAPERWLWKVGVAYGLAAWVLILFPLALATIPVVGPRLPVHRITGARPFAARVETVRQRTAPALIVAANYGPAARLAYYLPDRPAVGCARSWLGGAHTAYDYFADTNLADPRWRGRDVMLVGGNEQRWRRALRFEQWEAVPGEPAIWIGRRYGGPAND